MELCIVVRVLVLEGGVVYFAPKVVGRLVADAGMLALLSQSLSVLPLFGRPALKKRWPRVTVVVRMPEEEERPYVPLPRSDLLNPSSTTYTTSLLLHPRASLAYCVLLFCKHFTLYFMQYTLCKYTLCSILHPLRTYRVSIDLFRSDFREITSIANLDEATATATAGQRDEGGDGSPAAPPAIPRARKGTILAPAGALVAVKRRVRVGEEDWDQDWDRVSTSRRSCSLPWSGF